MELQEEVGMNSNGTVKIHHIITQNVAQLTKQVDAIRTHEKQQVVALMEQELSEKNLMFAIFLLCSFLGVGTFFFSLGWWRRCNTCVATTPRAH